MENLNVGDILVNPRGIERIVLEVFDDGSYSYECYGRGIVVDNDLDSGWWKIKDLENAE